MPQNHVVRARRVLAPLVSAIAVAIATAPAAPVLAQCPTPAWATGYNFPGVQGQIKDAVVYNGELYIGGSIFLAGSTTVSGLAKWNGTSWVAVGAGVFTSASSSGVGSTTAGSVSALCVYDNKLYIGGNFRHVNYLSGATVVSVRASNIVAFDGTVFSPLGIPINVAANNQTTDGPGITRFTGGQLSVADLAEGPDGNLYIGGDFDQVVNSVSATTVSKTTIGLNIAKYNSTTKLLSGVAAGGANSGTGSPASPTTVAALAVYNDGTGNHLYAGGLFSSMGGHSTGGLAELVDASWSAVGGVTTDGNVTSLAVFDSDSAGPNLPILCIGGQLASGYGVEQLSGSTRTTLGNLNDLPVSLATFDDGSGVHLYAATVNSSTLVKKWTGAAWDNLPGSFGHGANPANGTLPISSVLAPYTPMGGTSELYLFGNFTHVDSTVANNAARWNGSRWAGVPAGQGATTLFNSPPSGANAGGVSKVVKLDPDGAGPAQSAVYAIGPFETLGGIVANHIAKFDGHDWSALGTGLGLFPGNGDYPRSILTFDDGTGTALFAVNSNDSLSTLHKWNGSSWVAIPGGTELTVYSAVAFNNAIYIAGGFETINGIPASKIAKWTPADGWSAVSADIFSGTITQLAVHDGKLYAAGSFADISGTTMNNIAVWDNTSWSSLTDAITTVRGTTGTVNALLSYNGTLYVGGSFTAPFARIAAWDTSTSSWSDIGGVSGGFNPAVFTLAIGTDTGATPALFVGGGFNTVGASAVAANGIARYDLASGTWSPLISNGVNGITYRGLLVTSARVPGLVSSIASLGNLVIASGGGADFDPGSFTDAGGTGATCLALWGCAATPCPADFNSDNIRDVADLFGYINAWLAKTSNADFNHDTLVDVADLFGFINAWLAGC